MLYFTHNGRRIVSRNHLETLLVDYDKTAVEMRFDNNDLAQALLKV